MPESSMLYFAVVAGNITLGVVVGWCLCYTCQPGTWSGKEKTNGVPDPVLMRLQKYTAQYDARVRDFEDALHTGSDGETRSRVKEMHRSSCRYQNALSSEIGGLSKLAMQGRPVLRPALEELVRHGGQVDRFNRILGELLDKPMPRETRTLLGTAVAGLVTSNRRMEQELKAAKRELDLQKKQLNEARQEARADALTRLPNRRAFEEKHEETHARLNEEGDGYAVALLNVDQLGKVNTDFGHPAGDSVLQVLAHVVQGAVRSRDTVARLEGDEFAILLPGAGAEEVKMIAERCREQLGSAAVRCGDATAKFTVSIGVTVAEQGDTTVEVLERAGAALSMAKKNDRNQVRFTEEPETVVDEVSTSIAS